MTFLLLPPIAFLIVFIAVICLTRVLSGLAITGTTKGKGQGELYACGEEFPDTRIQPNYAQFFPFAFFFTVMHVVVLTVATVPAGALRSHPVAILYLAAACIGLLILYRREI